MIKKLTIFSLIASMAATSFAGTLSDYPNYQNLINNDNVVLYSYWGCLDDGYEQQTSSVDPVYHIAIPQGDHLDATVTITMTRKPGGPYSLTTEYIFIKVDIWDDGQGNLSVGTVTIERQTVY